MKPPTSCLLKTDMKHIGVLLFEMFDYAKTIKTIKDYFYILHLDKYIMNVDSSGHNQERKSLHSWSIQLKSN